MSIAQHFCLRHAQGGGSGGWWTQGGAVAGSRWRASGWGLEAWWADGAEGWLWSPRRRPHAADLRSIEPWGLSGEGGRSRWRRHWACGRWLYDRGGSWLF